jgi:small subunit ribosomal protein S24e
MELEIKENNDNPLLHRKEIKLVINHENDSTPKRNQVIRDLSEQLKAKKELIIIDHLKNKYSCSEVPKKINFFFFAIFLLLLL